MFVSVSSRCFAEMEFSVACRQVQDLLFDRLEIWIDQAGKHLALSRIADDPEGFAAHYREQTRLTPIAFQFEGDITPEQFLGVCKACKLLRITQVTVPAAPSGTPFNSEIDRLKELTKVAVRDGVRVSIKTETGRLTGDLRTAVEFCQAVPGLGLTFDPSYFLRNPLGDKALDLIAPHVFHVHLRDSTPEQLQVQVGLGEVDYSRIISQLEKVKYQRALSVELIPGLTDLEQRPLELRKLRMLLESLM